MKMQLKDEKIKLILGPMAGVTDLPFRLLCSEYGADEVITEMVSAKAILYKNKNTNELLRTCETEKNVRVQLFGNDPEICADIALRLQEMGCWKAIDFNMGCPVPKIVNNGEGSALMKDPALAGRIIEAMASKLEIPVTVKIRAGFDKEHKNAAAFAKILESAGANEIAVHGRTREEYYSGKADWDVIRDVKNAVKIPVCGNGDVAGIEDAYRMREYTGCDSVMIARGALGRPWVFSRETGLNGPDRLKITNESLRNLILRHLSMQIQHEGEYMAIRQMRKHIAWYTQGLSGSAAFRNKINTIEDRAELEENIVNFFDKLN